MGLGLGEWRVRLRRVGRIQGWLVVHKGIRLWVKLWRLHWELRYVILCGRMGPGERMLIAWVACVRLGVHRIRRGWHDRGWGHIQSLDEKFAAFFLQFSVSVFFLLFFFFLLLLLLSVPLGSDRLRRKRREDFQSVHLLRNRC